MYTEASLDGEISFLTMNVESYLRIVASDIAMTSLKRERERVMYIHMRSGDARHITR